MIVITIIIIISIIVNAFEYQYYNIYEDKCVIVLIHFSFPLFKNKCIMYDSSQYYQY